MRCGPSFASARWASTSSAAKEFVELLMHQDPNSRPSAFDALQHPWLESVAASVAASPLRAAPAESPRRDDDDDACVNVAAMDRHACAQAFDALTSTRTTTGLSKPCRPSPFPAQGSS